MDIVDNKALLLRLKNPAHVLAAVPDSVAVDEHTVAVRWGVPQVQALRNLNIHAPSPIEKRYAWPGKFRPMSHQRETAAFFTAHKRAFCFSEQGCVDSETEYLSPTGWVKISEYAGGKVAQYHPETGAAEFVEPDKFVKLPCETMVRIKTKHGLDQMLSPEHRTLVRSNAADKWCVMPAAEVLRAHDDHHAGVRRPNMGKARSSTVGFAHMAIPTVFSISHGAGIPLSPEALRLQVAVICDGYFGKGTPWCVVRLKRKRKVERMRKLLAEAGVEYTEREQNTPTAQGFHIFKFNAPMRCKEFGPEFWECDAAQRAIIAEEVVYWDGSEPTGNRGPRFSTTNKATADFVQYVWTSSGHTARITEDTRDKYRGGVCYTVTARGNARGGAFGLLSLKSRLPTVDTAPSTDGFKYCFMVPSTYLLFRRNGCVFASGNTGKTASAIWAADFLMQQGLVRRALVICPVSIMDSAWRADLFSFAMHRRVDIAYGPAKKRAKIIESDAEFVIINYDGVQIVADQIQKGGFDLIIVDEASHYQNAQTRRWKALDKLVGPDTWLWMMTGTPAAQGPDYAYGLAKLVNPKTVPRFFNAFRDMVMYKISNFKWGVKENAAETVHRVLQPAIRFTKAECLDLPDLVYVKRVVEMTPQQKKFYEKLRKELLMQAAGENVTAGTAAVAMTKLLQISSGSVYTDEQNTLQFDISSRYKVLSEVLAETKNKVLVFVPFRNAIDLLSTRLRGDGITCEVISGAVPASERTDIFRAFQTETDPRVLVVQPQAAAHGVTLTAADTIVWWGPTASLEIYEQANARIHRQGQKNKCTVVQLVGSPVEKRVYDLLDNKIDLHRQVIDLYNNALD
jgi:superfamily II DNA or RNA helicase